MCKPQILSCNIINNCDVKAECKYSFDAQGYRCQCINGKNFIHNITFFITYKTFHCLKKGFVGDGFSCRPLRTCREDPSVCDRNAECLYIDQLQTHSCHCRYGFVGDGFQCSVAPRHDGDYLIFTQGMSLLRIPLQPTKEDVGKLILTKPHQIPAGLDVDCLQGYVYWSDVAHGVIYRASYNGTISETVIEGVLRSPEGVAVDWVSRNIYWTDSLKDTIEVSKIDGTMRKTLISEGLGDPRGIVVHPGRYSLLTTFFMV
jgi:nidogen (entactin)